MGKRLIVISLVFVLVLMLSVSAFSFSKLIRNTECNDGLDNDRNGDIDLGGCDCNGDGEIGTGLGSQSALRVSLCEETGSVAGYDTWCKYGGEWYDNDDGCASSRDNLEKDENQVREIIYETDFEDWNDFLFWSGEGLEWDELDGNQFLVLDGYTYYSQDDAPFSIV